MRLIDVSVSGIREREKHIFFYRYTCCTHASAKVKKKKEKIFKVFSDARALQKFYNVRIFLVRIGSILLFAQLEGFTNNLSTF